MTDYFVFIESDPTVQPISCDTMDEVRQILREYEKATRERCFIVTPRMLHSHYYPESLYDFD